jgi:hypothetical protein
MTSLCEEKKNGGHAVLQYQLLLPETATARVEALIHQTTCPAHPGTSTWEAKGQCDMCAITQVAEDEAPYEADLTAAPRGSSASATS